MRAGRVTKLMPRVTGFRTIGGARVANPAAERRG